ncbi:DUF4167 domain-containing protein [Methylosinus sp. H3A]|uniref:DUF4167 domain-containing protein n=1 Tax=Methylosinus sp. H3A TaxID=2785786 RepID=UPI0018C32FBC|nr:DUF4167 domain-containing protein [Methylosinus sp. H3A]MBG0812267.1 DUF4167 domain-containing protein [Methylosinus sp. H3A]
MRPGQNKRIRGRNGGRKGPNPLTRSYESNGPDVKIRGTAQHVAEKYLQLARDAQSSGDTIMAESLLQHAEHYFRLIAAAQTAQQQAQGGYGGRPYEAAETDIDDDDDFSGISDRFAPLSERLPQTAGYQPPPQPYASAPYAPQPAAQPQFAQQPQPQPQPYEERPIGERPVNEPRYERQPRQDRGGSDRGGSDRGGFRDRRDRDRGGEQTAEGGGERPPRQNFDRNRERRFPPRVQPAVQDEAPAAALPSFITAPIRAAGPEETETFARTERTAIREHEEAAAGFHLNQRRRRRTRAPNEDANGNVASSDEPPRSDELPLAD